MDMQERFARSVGVHPADDGLTMARISTASLSIIAELLEIAANDWDDQGARHDDGAAYIRADQARERVAGIQRAIARAETTVPS